MRSHFFEEDTILTSKDKVEEAYKVFLSNTKSIVKELTYMSKPKFERVFEIHITGSDFDRYSYRFFKILLLRFWNDYGNEKFLERALCSFFDKAIHQDYPHVVNTLKKCNPDCTPKEAFLEISKGRSYYRPYISFMRSILKARRYSSIGLDAGFISGFFIPFINGNDDLISENITNKAIKVSYDSGFMANLFTLLRICNILPAISLSIFNDDYMRQLKRKGITPPKFFIEYGKFYNLIKKSGYGSFCLITDTKNYKLIKEWELNLKLGRKPTCISLV